MDCPPPVNEICYVEKNGVRLAEFKCTTAFYCPERKKVVKKTIGTLVFKTHDEAMKLLETKPNGP